MIIVIIVIVVLFLFFFISSRDLIEVVKIESMDSTSFCIDNCQDRYTLMKNKIFCIENFCSKLK